MQSAAPVEIRNFGRVLSPLFADLAPHVMPAFLARLERIAASRYRFWATAAPTWAAELLACADREDEIAERVLACFPIDAETAAELDARIPAACDQYAALFDPYTVREQLTLQAAAERQGANAWRTVSASPGLSAATLAELAACSALEEATAAVVDDLLSRPDPAPADPAAAPAQLQPLVLPQAVQT
jgi:hypothetical protein